MSCRRVCPVAASITFLQVVDARNTLLRRPRAGIHFHSGLLPFQRRGDGGRGARDSRDCALHKHFIGYVPRILYYNLPKNKSTEEEITLRSLWRAAVRKFSVDRSRVQRSAGTNRPDRFSLEESLRLKYNPAGNMPALMRLWMSGQSQGLSGPHCCRHSAVGLVSAGEVLLVK